MSTITTHVGRAVDADTTTTRSLPADTQQETDPAQRVGVRAAEIADTPVVLEATVDREDRAGPEGEVRPPGGPRRGSA